MSILTQQEHKRCVAYFDFVREAIAPLTVGTDTIYEVQRFLETAPETHQLSKTLCPTINYITSDRSFGLFIYDNEKPIACVCARRIDTDDFVRQWITTYRLFGNMVARIDGFEPFEYVDDIPTLKGVVGYGGGSYVHPDYRDMNLAHVTSRLGKVLALTHFDADFYCALIKETNNRTAWAATGLQWPRSRFLTTGHHPGRDNWPQDVRLHWMDKDQIIDMLGDREPIEAVGECLRTRL